MQRFAYLLAVLSSFGCASIEGSSESSADSSAGSVESLTSPFESSSTSSGSGGEQAKTSYMRDVQAYTLAYLLEPAPEGEFARGLGDLARAHGINDWEADAATLDAIDRAIADLGAPPETLAALQRELDRARIGT